VPGAGLCDFFILFSEENEQKKSKSHAPPQVSGKYAGKYENVDENRSAV
jgi:hypothetical protein